MRARLMLLICLLGCLPAAAGGATSSPARHVDPATLDSDALLALDEGAPLKCGTAWYGELHRRQLLDGALARADEDSIYTYETPEGHFVIEYSITGTLAVDSTDTDLSGVPDYVEQNGRAFERSWSVEIDSLGFAAPSLAGGPYSVSLRYGGGAFGFLHPAGARIFIHRDMGSFCEGEPDPASCAERLLVATVAHEFKHASQFAAGWDLFGVRRWAELDATWIEDLVFDDSNDYYRYIATSLSPFVTPTTSLLIAYYEHCVWHGFLSENFSSDFVLELEQRVSANPFLAAVQRHYPLIAQGRALDWVQLWGDYTVSICLSGSRAAPGIGFAEAADYPDATVETVPGIPASLDRSLEDLAMRFHEFDTADSTGLVEVAFAGLATVDWTLRVIYQRADETLVVPVEVTNGVAAATPPHAIEDFDRVLLLVGNARVPTTTAAGAASYNLELGLKSVPVQGRSLGRFKGRFRAN